MDHLFVLAVCDTIFQTTRKKMVLTFLKSISYNLFGEVLFVLSFKVSL